MTSIVPPPVHSIETLAYIAGLFDGEGSISIAVSHPAKTNRRINPTYWLFITMSNTYKPVIEWAKNTFTGSLTSVPYGNIQWKPSWTWTIQGSSAQQFLKQILPYLKIKQEQAMVAIEFQDYHLSCKYHQTKETLDQEEAYHQRVQVLNGNIRALPQSDIPASLHSVEILAYTAGLFDGEGSLKIVVVRPTERSKRNNELLTPSYYLHASLTNTDHPVIEWMRTTFSGEIVRRLRDHRKPVRIWRIRGSKAQNFLQLILPYLKIKREQATLCIEFQDYHRSHCCQLLINRTRDVIEHKESYRQRIHNLSLYNVPIKGIEEWLSARLP